MFTFNHMNFNVKNLEESVKFYEDILGFKIERRSESDEKGYRIVFMGDGVTDFQLELTWLKDHCEAYDLGEQEYHLAVVADDFAATYKKHQDMGIIIYDNKDMGIYFLEDPDGYWIEIIPPKK